MAWEPGGKVAVVTGASSGIGEATARRLAAVGMTVVAVARRGEDLRQLADRSPGVIPHVADVTDTAAVDGLAERVRAELDACHVLVNSAGVPGGPFRRRDDLDDTIRTVDINLLGTIRCTAAFADLLAASAPSRVVNIGSIAGKLGVGPAAYAASKFGVVGFSEAVGLAWARRGITVCQLNPGFIRTQGFPQTQFMRTPLRRLVGHPDDVADAVLEVLRSGRRERTVPRWYRPATVARHAAAPLYWMVASRTRRAGGTRD